MPPSGCRYQAATTTQASGQPAPAAVPTLGPGACRVLQKLGKDRAGVDALVDCLVRVQFDLIAKNLPKMKQQVGMPADGPSPHWGVAEEGPPTCSCALDQRTTPALCQM